VTNVWHQVGNEPLGKGDLSAYIAWLVEVIRLAEARGLKVAVPGFGVGNPDEMLFDKGVFDPLIRAVRTHHLIHQHEYFFVEPQSEPFHIGRVLFWRDRARQLGLPRPKIVVSEAGKDKGGGAGDGWMGQGWNQAYYLDLLLKQAAVYRPFDIPMLVFCYGTGARTQQNPQGDWWSFDVQKADWLLNGISRYNEQVRKEKGADVTELPPNTPTRVGQVKAIPSTTDVVNIRQSPTTAATVVGTLKIEEDVRFAEPPQYPGWYWVKKQTGIEGWTSKQGGAVVIEAYPDQTPQPQFTKDELKSLAVLHTGIATIFQAAADRMAE
jgi:hypothetical protein